MRTGLIWNNQQHPAEYAKLFDEVVGNYWWGGRRDVFRLSGEDYTGLHPQKHWLSFNSQMVPGKPGTWQYNTNPIKLTNKHSREWRLPAPYSHLYDIRLPAYREAVVESAIRAADALSKDHEAFITGIFWDSICGEWWWGEVPERFNVEEYRQAQAEFCALAAQACRTHRYEVGANVAPASVEWPGSLDFVWLEHCTINAPIPAVIADEARTFRVGVNFELIYHALPYVEQFELLLARYTPLTRPSDCIMVNNCDAHHEHMERLMRGYADTLRME